MNCITIDDILIYEEYSRLAENPNGEFIANYWRAKIEYEELKDTANKCEADLFKGIGEPNWLGLLRDEQSYLGKYLHCVEIRAKILGIDLDDILYVNELKENNVFSKGKEFLESCKELKEAEEESHCKKCHNDIKENIFEYLKTVFPNSKISCYEVTSNDEIESKARQCGVSDEELKAAKATPVSSKKKRSIKID